MLRRPGSNPGSGTRKDGIVFKPGDLIIGIAGNPYGITGPNSICEVIEYGEPVRGDVCIIVRYLGKRGEKLDMQSHRTFPVLPEWFRKYSAKMK